jgi:hypothetical protein
MDILETRPDANYAIMTGDPHSRFCVLNYIEGFEDDYKLFIGVSVAHEWPNDVSLRMDPDFKKQIKLSDHLLNPSNVIVASKRLREFLQEKEVPNIEYLPVTILNHKNRLASSEYCIANLVTTQDCIDISKSGVTWNIINPDYITSIKQLVIDETKIDNDAVLFRAKHLKTAIFIRKDLARQIRDGGFSGIRFWEVSDFRR